MVELLTVMSFTSIGIVIIAWGKEEEEKGKGAEEEKGDAEEEVAGSSSWMGAMIGMSRNTAGEWKRCVLFDHIFTTDRIHKSVPGLDRASGGQVLFVL